VAFWAGVMILLRVLPQLIFVIEVTLAFYAKVVI
jgi:hypothetical protein